MGFTRDMLEQLGRYLHPVKVRIANSIARAVLESVDDGKKLQLLQLGVQAGETVDEAERFQEYGFYSVPLAGAEAVVLFPNGDRGHPLVVAVDDRRYRPTGGEPGEVGLYNSATGTRIRLMPNGDLVVTPKAGRKIKLGSSSAADAVALKSDLQVIVNAVAAAISGAVSGDGGVAAFTAFQTTLTTALFPRGAGKIDGE